MKRWEQKIKIRDISEDKDYNNNLDFTEQKKNSGKLMLKRLNDYSFIPKSFGKRFLKIKTLNGFNGILDDLYDYCDNNNIWVEF